MKNISAATLVNTNTKCGYKTHTLFIELRQVLKDGDFNNFYLPYRPNVRMKVF